MDIDVLALTIQQNSESSSRISLKARSDVSLSLFDFSYRKRIFIAYNLKWYFRKLTLLLVLAHGLVSQG